MQDYNSEYQEQTGGGAGFAAHAEAVDDTADSGSNATVRIVPLRAGERTVGHRKNGDEAPAIWDSDVLREAVEQDLLTDPLREDRPNSLIVKGRGGTNPHHAMSEQVDPDRILGRIDRWEYDEAVGPVGYAELADESVADKIELGLLDVSGDWLRRLGEYDEGRGGKPVTEVIGLPRIHVLERGAAQGASVEIAPETAEALGYNPDSPNPYAEIEDAIEQQASEGDAVKWKSASGGSREPPNDRYGVVVNPAPDDSDRDWMVAVYQPDPDYSSWEPRDETQPMSDDSLERVGSDGVGSLPAVSQVVEQDAGFLNRLASRVADMIGDDEVDQLADTDGDGDGVGNNDPSDEEDPDDPDGEEGDGGDTNDPGEETNPGEAPSDDDDDDDPDGDDDPDDSDVDDSGANAGDADTGPEQHSGPTTTNMDDITELQEQLAEVRSEKKSLKEENDDLESQLAARESTIEEKEETLSEKDETIEQQSETIEDLEKEVEPLVGLLAQIAADGSMLDPDKIAETHSARDLVDLIADDSDDSKSYREKVEEQMAGTFAPRGDADQGGSGGEDLDEEAAEQVEQMAESVMTARDWKQAQDFSSNREYVRTTKGVDPANAASEQELRQQIKAQGEN